MAHFKLFLYAPQLNEKNYNIKGSFIGRDFFINENADTSYELRLNDKQLSSFWLEDNNDYLRAFSKYYDISFNEDNFTLFGETDEENFHESEYSFSFDESLTVGKNAQESLTFKLTKFYLKNDSWEENPFVKNMYVGNLIKLVDKYNTTHLFIITSISFEFKEKNIIYSYSCSDYFNEQMSRLNSGYQVANDPNKKDFLGAKTVEQWIEKIVDDCNIPYTYLPLEYRVFKVIKSSNPSLLGQFVYQDLEDSNLFYLLSGERIFLIDMAYWELQEVRRGIRYAKEPDYYRTFCFTCSNSSALNALITAAEKVGLILEVDYATKVFWLKDHKNPDFTGIYYSPYRNLQSFSLSQSSEGLASIFNIKGPTIGDTTVSLLPPITPFFKEIFSSDLWAASTYVPGLYSQMVKKSIQKYNWSFSQQLAGEESNIINTSDEILFLNKTYSNGAKHFKFIEKTDEVNVIGTEDSIENSIKTLAENMVYRLQISEESSQNPTFADNLFILLKNQKIYYYYGFSFNVNQDVFKWYPFVSLNQGSVLSFKMNSNNIYIKGLDLIQVENSFCFAEGSTSANDVLNIQNKTSFLLLIDSSLFIKEGLNQPLKLNTANSYIYFDYIRSDEDISEDDLKFAECADFVPFLENKIIKSDYLKSIYNPFLYNKWYDIVYNELRINNALLLIHRDLYYTSFMNTTTTLSNVQCAIDELCAFLVTSIDCAPSKDDERPIEKETQESLERKQNKLWGTISNVSRLTGIKDELDQQIRLYWNYWQQFCKNIYLFTSFFNAKTDIVGSNNMTNGEYYYNYFNDVDKSQQIYDIEYTLQQYWGAATSASRMIHYFLPTEWRLQVGANNSKVPITYDIIIKENEIVKLNSAYIPQITKTNKIYPTPYFSIQPDKGVRVIDSVYKNGWWSLFDGTNAVLYASYNDFIQDYIYYIENNEAGILWRNAYKKNTSFPKTYCSGWLHFYIAMLFELLPKNFSDEKLKEYTKKNKDIWKELYKNYGMLMKESSFSSTTAINSTELLKEALNYYKDYEKPKTSYGLTVIDYGSIKKINNIPIRIGDQIALNYEDFYYNQDYLKTIIQERLFVTGITYNLRKDSDIQFTVETVSYQDKLISKLINLIK